MPAKKYEVRTRLSSKVKYSKSGSLSLITKLNAINDKSEIIDNSALVLISRGSIQNTPQEIKTINIIGKANFNT